MSRSLFLHRSLPTIFEKRLFPKPKYLLSSLSVEMIYLTTKKEETLTVLWLLLPMPEQHKEAYEYSDETQPAQ